MNTLISKITRTENLFINLFVAVVVTFIAVTLIAVVCNILVNPLVLERAF